MKNFIEHIKENTKLKDDDVIKLGKAFPLGKKWSLNLYKDDDGTWNLCIISDESLRKIKNGDGLGEVGVTFAYEDENDSNSVTINDHGIIPQQYLSKEQKMMLEEFGLLIGAKYKNMEELWAAAKRMAQQPRYKKLQGKDSVDEAFSTFLEYKSKEVNESSYTDFLIGQGQRIKDCIKKINKIAKAFDKIDFEDTRIAKLLHNAMSVYDKTVDRAINHWISLPPHSVTADEIARVALDNQNSNGTEMKQVLNAIDDFYLVLARNDENVLDENNGSLKLFCEHISEKESEMLTEQEKRHIDDMRKLFEEEYSGDVNNLDEGFFGKLIGGIGGFAFGPSIGKIVAKALGVEKGILYDLFCSRLVGAALGAAIGNHITGIEKKK